VAVKRETTREIVRFRGPTHGSTHAPRWLVITRILSLSLIAEPRNIRHRAGEGSTYTVPKGAEDPSTTDIHKENGRHHHHHHHVTSSSPFSLGEGGGEVMGMSLSLS
jgi:hypothetical protein